VHVDLTISDNVEIRYVSKWNTLLFKIAKEGFTAIEAPVAPFFKVIVFIKPLKLIWCSVSVIRLVVDEWMKPNSLSSSKHHFHCRTFAISSYYSWNINLVMLPE